MPSIKTISKWLATAAMLQTAFTAPLTRPSASSSNTSIQSNKTLNIGYLLFPGYQPLDVFGPLDILTMHSWTHPLSLHLIGETSSPISTAHWNTSQPANAFSWALTPTATFSCAKELNLDVLFVPGGLGTRSPHLASTIDFVRDIYPSLKYLISVCTGAGILARAGVLDGRNATTNKAAWKQTTGYGQKTNWIAKARWIRDGNVVTTAGVSAGIDGTLGWIGETWGVDVAEKLAQMGEVVWNRGEDTFAEVHGVQDVRPE